MNRIYFYILLLQLISVSLYSQSKTVHLTGRVVDKISRLPIPFSEVILSNDSATVLLHGIVYSDDASFKYENVNLQGSSITLEVRSLGYDKMTITAPMDYIEGEINLGEIELPPTVHALETITIFASAIKKDVNKSTYFIGESYLKNASVSLDVLRKVPELIVNDINRSVNIKGKENTLVLINGVNTGESVDIRSISHTEIARIEVVDIPTSSFQIEYDGIINIILKTKRTNKFSIDVEETVKGDLRSNTGYVALRVGLDKVRMRLSYDNYYRGMPTKMIQNRVDNDTKSTYNTDGNMKRREWSHDIRFDLDYYLSDKDFLNISTNTSLSDNNKKLFNTQYQEINNTITPLPDFETRFNSKYTVGNYTLYYKHKFNKPQTQITFNGNFNFQNTIENVETDYTSGKNFLTNETGDKISSNLKIDYESQLSASLRFNIGTQGYYQDFDSKINQTKVINSFLNYKFNAYTDAFWNYKQTKFTFGIKAENNNYNFKESDGKTINHFIIMPRIAIMNTLNDRNTLSINYNRKSYYPSAWALSPYTIQIDEKTSSIGNPKLKPQTFDYLGLSHTYSKENFFLRTTASYYRGKKIISETRNFDSQLNIIVRPDNVGTSDQIAIKSVASFKLFSFMQFDPEVLSYYQKYDINGSSRHKYGLNFRGALYTILPHDFSMGAMGFYKTQQLTTIGRIKPIYALDYIFLSKKFPKIGLTLFAGYQDLIKCAERSYTINENFTECVYSKTKTRGFAFRLIYNFISGTKVSMESIPNEFDLDKK